MTIITQTVTLVPPPDFVGTRLYLVTTTPNQPFGIYSASLATSAQDTTHQAQDTTPTCTIDWGDGTLEHFPPSSAQGTTHTAQGTLHTYSRPGVYTVHISDDLASLSLSTATDVSPYTDVSIAALVRVSSNATRLKTLGRGCFRNATRLASLDLTAIAVRGLSEYTFANCASLRTLDGLPAAVSAMRTNVFPHCTSLVSVADFPPRVTVLYGATFTDCISLAGRLDFPHIKSLVGSASGQPFAGCTGGITEIHFPAASESAITASALYQADPTLGTATAQVLFDL